jgi:hypothetical protein
MKHTAWTRAEFDDFIAWHEEVIAKYPQSVMEELRGARESFMRGIKIKGTQ